MEHKDTAQLLNKLIQDPDFLELKSLQSRSNLFEIVAASHTEMWHSAFMKWILDPSSSLGLGTYPIKRFLFMVRYEGLIQDQDDAILELDLAVIEDEEELKLDQMIFETEYTDKLLAGKRLDIMGANDTIRITIENKINAREAEDQTIKYYNYLKQTSNFKYDVMVFLCPDESRVPSSRHFIQVNYQQICDHVLKPILKHPELSTENKYLVLQYLSNLGKPLKGGRVMAQPNKELCLKIYNAYKEVFDEIFIAAKDEAPSVKSGGMQIKSYNTTLSQLIADGILSLEDELHAFYKGERYEATLVKDQANGAITIKAGDVLYGSPSKAASSITGKNANGWVFWNVMNSRNEFKGSLAELRAKAEN